MRTFNFKPQFFSETLANMSCKQFILFVLVLVHLVSGSPYNWPKSDNGFISNRIVGGKPAPEGMAPHMVALLVGAEPWVIMMCGGSIVSTKHVLTAAHCIDSMVDWYDSSKLSESLRGIVGSNRHTSTENVITFKSYINHPDWNSRAIKNDVGVLFTTKEIVLSDRVALISIKKDWVHGGEAAYATGWGNNGDYVVPEQLQLLHVPTIEMQDCIKRINDTAAWLGGTPPPVEPRFEICTLHSVGHGMCNGDSGSALVCEKTGKQIGIVSWGYPCAIGAPDIFVRISAYWEFLKPILEG